MRPRDYAYEALAEVTGTDPQVGRGALNAALRDIRAQSRVEDSYLLADEIHAQAKLYRQVYEGAALTPTALSKHWTRLPEEAKKLKRGGTNLHVGYSGSFPPSNRERNLEEARKLLAKLSE